MIKVKTLAVVTGVTTLAVLGVMASTLTNSTVDTIVTTDATTGTFTMQFMRDATPTPLPPFGAKVTLRGCSQVATVTAKTTSPGVVFVSGDAAHWVTKVVATPAESLSPPVFKGKMQPGVWINFTRLIKQVFVVYYASSNCPGTSNPYKWNASKVTVSVN